MPRTNFQYDETGNTYNYVFLTFLSLILLPSTYFFWPFSGSSSKSKDAEAKRAARQSQQSSAADFSVAKAPASARYTVYGEACAEKAERLDRKDPWAGTRRAVASILLSIGWLLFFRTVYRISQFDYEMANFDPYEILQVSYDATAKEIKKKYREMSLKYHPDKPTGDEKKFMKLTKAYDALTDETAKYNWEHYGNPDGPQAMEFGIGLPAWIVDEKNSIWVLGFYTLIFMVGLPTAVYYWWSNSIKFSGESVLLDTTQLYYYFFHKTPHMMLRRVMMVLAASLEFERGHNSEIVERPTDNAEIPQLMKVIPNLGVNNKEKPLCFGYSIKARVLLFAHLSRIALSPATLHQDRLYVIKKCPFLIQEMVQCISQLILLAHAGRIGRLPTLDTIEYAMKCSPMIVQALWDKCSPFLQLPHIEEDHLKYYYSRKCNVKTLHQLAKMKDEDRRSLMRSLTDEQYRDVIRVLSVMPIVEVDVTTEVVDDEEQHVVTAGAIITVTVVLTRKSMETLMSGGAWNPQYEDVAAEAEDKEPDVVLDTDDASEANGGEAAESAAENKKKTPVWRRPQQKKKGGKAGAGNKQKQKPKAASKATAATSAATAEAAAAASASGGQGEQLQQAAAVKASDDNRVGPSSTSDLQNNVRKRRRKRGDNDGGDGGMGSDSEADNSDSNGNSSGDDESQGQGGKVKESGTGAGDEEDDEAEWQRFQKRINKREKVLEGKSRVSHSVHCPYFTDDKQEYWWCYISDRKTHLLITPPHHVTSLIDREEVELKFTAPHKPGHYTFTVCVRSDSYLGLDVLHDIKLEVSEAREAPTDHPQWEFEDDADNRESDEDDSDGEFATDDDFEDDDENED